MRKAILLGCGSFNPPTNGHLRMMVVRFQNSPSIRPKNHLHYLANNHILAFGMLSVQVARELLEASPAPFAVVEGIFSPVSSAYAHKQLESDEHRMAMLSKVRAAIVPLFEYFYSE